MKDPTENPGQPSRGASLPSVADDARANDEESTASPQVGSPVALGSVMNANAPRKRWYRRLYDSVFNFFENPEKRNRQIYEFMPAALEIQNTPPSPAGRFIVWLIVIAFVFGGLWSFFGRVDIVAVAQGKVIPSGRVKTIQPLELGAVTQIHVKEGDVVKQGDLLVTLDDTASSADARKLEEQLATLGLELLRLDVFRGFLQDQKTQQQASAAFQSGLGELNLDPDMASAVSSNQRLLAEQISEYLSRQTFNESELDKRRAELEATDANIVKLNRIIPITEERVEAMLALYAEKGVSRSRYLEVEEKRINEQQELSASMARRKELNAAIAGIESQLKAVYAETLKETLNQITEQQINRRGASQELVKARQRNKMQVLKSPIDGAVQQLAVHTVGGIVTPAQELMVVVPEQDEVEVEAFLLNKDVGFVAEGHEAAVKIDTFNFTKYGFIDGVITDISDDAIQDEKLGLVYLTRVLLKENQIFVNENWVSLSPGMSVTVEVKTGKRRVIEFFLSPLLRYKEESIRER